MIGSCSGNRGYNIPSRRYSSLLLPALLILIIVILTVPVSAENPAVDPGVVTVFAVIPPEGQTNPHFQYQQGDTISLKGTNTGSRTTFLFLVGPNLNANGSQIQSEYPAGNPVVEGDASAFATAVVGEDGRWSYAWDTKKTTLADGVYTIYVVSKPHDKNHLALTPYGTTSVVLGKQQAPAMPRLDKYILEETVNGIPRGPVTSGTLLTVAPTVNFVLNGTETFPWDHDLVFSTALDDPHWTYTLYLDGVGNPRPAVAGNTLDLSGFELSYPGNVNEEYVVVTLRGNAPAVPEGRTKKVIQISIVDSAGNIVPDSTVIREITVLPAHGATTTYETPTTVPIVK